MTTSQQTQDLHSIRRSMVALALVSWIIVTGLLLSVFVIAQDAKSAANDAERLERAAACEQKVLGDIDREWRDALTDEIIAARSVPPDPDGLAVALLRLQVAGRVDLNKRVHIECS